MLNFNSSGGWEKSWEQGVTPWDLGQPTPIILHLHQTGALPKGRALVPGCGTVSSVVHSYKILLSDKSIQFLICLCKF